MSLNSKSVQGWTFIYDRDTAEITPSTDGTHTTLDITFTDATYLSDGLSSMYVMEPFRDADSATGLRQTVEIRLHNGSSFNFDSFTVMLTDLDFGFESDPSVHPTYAHWHNATTDNFPGYSLTATTNQFSAVSTAPGYFGGPSAAHFWTDGIVAPGTTVVWGTAGASDLVLHQRENIGFNDSFLLSYWISQEGVSGHGTSASMNASTDALLV